MSDDPSQLAGTDKARKMLAQSEKALDDILTAFDLMAERMRDGEDISPSELTKALTAIGQARTRLINEVKEHDNRVLLSEGLSADAPLDLEAIRTQIGRHIGRIRSALDEEGISREPEAE